MTLRPSVYFDHNATAPACPAARDAVLAAMTTCGNPSSVHTAGRAARQVMETARRAILKAFDAEGHELVFTSGGTEANALALTGLGAEHVIISATEHDSVRAAAKLAPHWMVCPVDEAGIVDLDALAGLLGNCPGRTLVSVHVANNETGVLQPVAAIAALVHEKGARLHLDAVQAAGKMPLSIKGLQADLVTISAHKLGGPMGAGALILRPKLDLAARQAGGGQEKRRRAGTENVPAIAGFAAAVAELPGRIEGFATIGALRDRLEAALGDRVDVHGKASPRLPNTSCFSNAEATGETQVMAMDLAGFQISSGAACSSGKVAESHVLVAMGLDPDRAGKAIRVSLGPDTTAADVDAFAAAWIAFHDRMVAAA